ncbi:MAG: hypothetical protein ACLTA5_07510 [Anaerococcus obesiensis]
MEGINLKEFENIFGHSLLEKYSEIVEKFYKEGFFEIDKNLRFTHKGLIYQMNFILK